MFPSERLLGLLVCLAFSIFLFAVSPLFGLDKLLVLHLLKYYEFFNWSIGSFWGGFLWGFIVA